MTIRSPLHFFTGSIPTQAGVVSVFYDVLTNAVTSMLSDGQHAWELYDQTNSVTGSIDRTYKSVGHRSILGGAGDTNLYLRIVQDSATNIYFVTMQDWASVSNNGSAAETNTAAVRPSNNNGNFSFPSSTAAIKYWIGVNEHSVLAYTRQSAAPRGMLYFHPTPPAPPNTTGRGRIITATTGSGNITLNLDRELSGTFEQKNVVQAGQKIWLVNQTPTGSSAVSDFCEIVTIEKVGNQKITLSGVQNSPYQSGSLIGINGNAQFGSVSLSTNSDVNVYCTARPDGGYTGINSQLGNRISYYNTFAQDDNPSPTNLFVHEVSNIRSTQTQFTANMGSSEVLRYATFDSSIQTNGSFLSSSNYLYAVFPSTALSNLCICFGPIDKSTIPWATASLAYDFMSGTADQYVYLDSQAIDYLEPDTWVVEESFPSSPPPAGDVINLIQNFTISYYQRALDVGGTGGYIYWTTIGAPDETPAPSETTPNYTGTLQSYSIVRVFKTENVS